MTNIFLDLFRKQNKKNSFKSSKLDTTQVPIKLSPTTLLEEKLFHEIPNLQEKNEINIPFIRIDNNNDYENENENDTVISTCNNINTKDILIQPIWEGIVRTRIGKRRQLWKRSKQSIVDSMIMIYKYGKNINLIVKIKVCNVQGIKANNNTIISFSGFNEIEQKKIYIEIQFNTNWILKHWIQNTLNLSNNPINYNTTSTVSSISYSPNNPLITEDKSIKYTYNLENPIEWLNEEKELSTIEEYKLAMDILNDLKSICNTIPISTVIRFLRAKDGNVDIVKDLVEKHIKWRKEMFPIEPESIRDELYKDKINVLGRDRKGHIIIWIFSRNMGPHTYNSLQDSIRSFVFGLERQEKEVLGPYEKFTVVYSQNGLTNSNIDIRWLKSISSILQNNYPERLAATYVLPCTFIIRVIWSAIKNFFDKKTASNIVMLSSNNDIVNYIDADNCIEEFDGNLRNDFDIEYFLGYRGMY